MLSPYFSWHVRNVSMICQNIWGDLEKGHLPCGITQIKMAVALNNTRLKKFDPPEIHLEM